MKKVFAPRLLLAAALTLGGSLALGQSWDEEPEGRRVGPAREAVEPGSRIVEIQSANAEEITDLDSEEAQQEQELDPCQQPAPGAGAIGIWKPARAHGEECELKAAVMRSLAHPQVANRRAWCEDASGVLGQRVAYAQSYWTHETQVRQLWIERHVSEGLTRVAPEFRAMRKALMEQELRSGMNASEPLELEWERARVKACARWERDQLGLAYSPSLSVYDVGTARFGASQCRAAMVETRFLTGPHALSTAYYIVGLGSCSGQVSAPELDMAQALFSPTLSQEYHQNLLSSSGWKGSGFRDPHAAPAFLR